MRKLQSQGPSNLIKFSILLTACFSVVCLYYCMDIPALIQSELVEHFTFYYNKQKSEMYFSFLYSFYNIPNIILPLIGGILIDEVGYKITTIIFIGFITIGQFIVTLGMYGNNFPLMIFGRLIFGIGGESINISIQKIIIKWFIGSELSFAFAINLSLLRVASIGNTLLTPRIAEFKNITESFLFGFLICLVSFLSVIILLYIDQKFENQIPNYQQQQQIQNEQIYTLTSEANEIKLQVNKLIFKFKTIIKKTMQNIFQFSNIFWILTILMITLYMSVLTFNTFSSTIVIDIWLQKLYPENTLEKNQEIAGDLMSIPYIVSSFCFPLFGFICDKYGQRAIFLLISPILIFIAFITLPLYYPTFSFALLGISYAIFGSIIWPTVTYLIPQNQIGIAFGAMGSLQNFGMGILPLIIAYIEVSYSSYVVIYVFIFISIVAICVAILLNIQNSKCLVSLNDKDQNKLTTYLKQQQETQNTIKEEEKQSGINKLINQYQNNQNNKLENIVEADIPAEQDDENEELLKSQTKV